VELTISNSSRRADLVTWVWQFLLFTLFYCIAGVLGLELNQLAKEGVADNATLAWLPSGLSLAVLILYGRRLWPGIFVGSLLLGSITSFGWIPWLGTSIGNTLESVVGATLLIRLADFRPTLERMRDGVAFLLIGVLGCTTISAVIGSASLIISGDLPATDFGLAFVFWWLGTAGGVLVLAPVVFMLAVGSPSWRSLFRRLESWVVLALLLATTLLVFAGPGLGLLGIAATMAPFPILVWAGSRLGPRGAVLASFLLIMIATITTGRGSGPFVTATVTEAMLLLWPYSIFMGISAFTMAAVIEQRNLVERMYRSEEAERLRIEKQKLLLIERERLTREMHDGLGGQLVSALSMIERGQADPDDVAETLRRAIDDVRIVIDSLDSDTADLPTSLGMLRARLEPLLRRNGVELRWTVDEIPDLDAFPPEAALHVLRIIQEAVMNSLRHAGADRIEMKLTSLGGKPRRLHVSIRDDGRGLSTPTPLGGRGLKNMKARAKELGAVLRIDGSRSGTKVDLTLPLPR